MDKQEAQAEREARFETYLDGLAAVIGHRDRHGPLRMYCTGLLLPGERKSVEPLAARLQPQRVSACHQSLLHFIGVAPWSDEAVLSAVREAVLPVVESQGPVEAWLIDDTGMPKKGRHSVGVKNQYCGVLGKNANCQVAVSLSLANEEASLPVAYRLYLPEEWATDPERRRKAGVPEQVRFERKWEISLGEIDQLLGSGVKPAPVVADAGYGDAVEFRQGLTDRHLTYVVGVSKNTTVWRPGQGPLPPPAYAGRGRPAKRVRRSPECTPVSVLQLAPELAATDWHTVNWRAGSRGPMTSRFAAVRVRPAHRDDQRTEPRPVEWLLLEWPEKESEPTHYWLSTQPESVTLEGLVRLAMLRWRVERDYQELKDEIGLDHYEGRGWRGFHHHATLCIAAYGFLTAEHARLSPPQPPAGPLVRVPPLPAGYRPRGAPAAR